MAALPLMVVAALALATVAKADGAGTSIIPNPANVDTTPASLSLGYEFVVGDAPVTVTALGFFEAAGTPWTESHAVGLYDFDGNLLASTILNGSDVKIGNFRYKDIGSLILDANASYIIAGVTGTVDAFAYNPTDLSSDPNIEYVFNRFELSNTLVFPTQVQDAVTGYWGPNFWINSRVGTGDNGNGQDVPEPGAFALLIGLGTGLSVVVRRRK
jgi:hypothetical protein